MMFHFGYIFRFQENIKALSRLLTKFSKYVKINVGGAADVEGISISIDGV